MTQGIPRAIVLEDWHWLHETGQLDPEAPLAERVRQAAPRIGMSANALQKALERAGIRNPVEPQDKPRPAGLDCVACRNANVELANAERDVRQLARKLAARPESTHLRALLDKAKATLAEDQAHLDMHVQHDHAEAEVAA